MNFKHFSLMTLLAATVCFSTSCAKKNPNGSDSDFASGTGDGSAYGSGSGGAYSDFGSGSLPNRDERFSYFNASTGQFEPVFFPFDSFRITSSEMRKIDAVASYMKKKGGDVLVAGFTDALGTEEYNRGLGDRRAHAVSQALSQRGVSRGKIETVSFGEEMLAEPTSPNSSRNRRVEFGIVK
jgi:peptidoglycan-associated lipoprotein